MRWSAELDGDCCNVFRDSEYQFSSEDMSEEIALKLVSALNAIDALKASAERLVKASDGYKTYDYHLNPENVTQIAEEARRALLLAQASIVSRQTIIK